MKINRLFLLLLFSVRLVHAQSSELATFIDREVTREPFDRAIWGILIEEDDGTVLYARNSATLLMPASNRKIFTSAFADGCLGPERRLTTDFWIDGPIKRGVLRGNLIIVGDGDPTFAGRFFPDRDAFLAPLVERLRSLGVRSIEGSVVADVSLFARDTVQGSWSVSDLWTYYGAPVDALAFNENVVGTALISHDCSAHAVADPEFAVIKTATTCGEETALDYSRDEKNVITIGGTVQRGEVRERELVSAADPALYTAEAIVDFLSRKKIVVRKGARTSAAPVHRLDRLLSIESPRLMEILNIILDNSQNLYTEMLLKRAAAESQARPIDYAKALEAERRFLIQEVGLDGNDFQFADGSGLSSENLVNPRAVVKTVRYLMQPQRRSRFLAILARPGSGGTLRNRLAGLEEVIRAKTGYIHATSTLSGVVVRPDGKLRFFSIMANHYGAAPAETRKIIDAIVRKIAE